MPCTFQAATSTAVDKADPVFRQASVPYLRIAKVGVAPVYDQVATRQVAAKLPENPVHGGPRGDHEEYAAGLFQSVCQLLHGVGWDQPEAIRQIPREFFRRLGGSVEDSYGESLLSDVESQAPSHHPQSY